MSAWLIMFVVFSHFYWQGYLLYSSSMSLLSYYCENISKPGLSYYSFLHIFCGVVLMSLMDDVIRIFFWVLLICQFGALDFKNVKLFVLHLVARMGLTPLDSMNSYHHKSWLFVVLPLFSKYMLVFFHLCV